MELDRNSWYQMLMNQISKPLRQFSFNFERNMGWGYGTCSSLELPIQKSFQKERCQKENIIFDYDNNTFTGIKDSQK